MTDQQRFDTISALGNNYIYTPNFDRLVRRGVTFTQAYSSCAECVPARYTIRTGCKSPRTLYFGNNEVMQLRAGQPKTMEGRCGPYLARTMKKLGYRTFGVGKFHTVPWDEELGYDVHLHSEELYHTSERRASDSYAAWVGKNYPQYDFQDLLGERTEMYYAPGRSHMPEEITSEHWAADRAVEQIKGNDKQPYFGFVSFINPHPPLAPPIPFNRLYNPDRMPNPVRGAIEVDHMDEYIPWMNYFVWAEDISDAQARIIKARYYGEITHIDYCLGRILDAVESRSDADNTLICFFSDHGEHLGDHHAWQKESFFEASCHIPFLVSWPRKLMKDTRRGELVCLADLFGIATHAAGATQTRDGIDVLGVLNGEAKPREYLVGYYGKPGTPLFKMMVRDKQWKYIYISNGGREQLFDVLNDPMELKNLAGKQRDVAAKLKQKAISACKENNLTDAMKGSDLLVFPHKKLARRRVYQFDNSKGIKKGFLRGPKDILSAWRAKG
jgi:choline-sulfatase